MNSQSMVHWFNNHSIKVDLANVRPMFNIRIHLYILAI